MDHKKDFDAAIDELEALLQRSASIPDSACPSERKEALELRRNIAEQNSKVATLGEIVFSTRNTEQAFRRELTDLRVAIASHLSEWPISTIDMTDARYLASLLRLRQAYRRFIDWIRRELAR